MIGPIFYQRRRRPPSEVARLPHFERRVKAPIGWLVERLAAPLGRWEREQLLRTPEVVVPIVGLPREFAGYRIALLTDLHHGPAVPRWWLERAADRATALAPDLIALGGDFVSHARTRSERFGAGARPIPNALTGSSRCSAITITGSVRSWWPGVVAAPGVELLLNRHRLIRRGAAGLAVAGVDDLTHGAVRFGDALDGVPDSSARRPAVPQSRPRGVPPAGQPRRPDVVGAHSQRPDALAAHRSAHGALAVRRPVSARTAPRGAHVAVRVGWSWVGGDSDAVGQSAGTCRSCGWSLARAALRTAR